MKRYKVLLCAIPLAWLLFFIAVSLSPSSVPFPELSVLGSAPVINIEGVTPNHLFYIASYAPIEDEYDLYMRRLQFRVFDGQGREVSVRRVARFFYTGKARVFGKSSRTTVHCGSVFRLPKETAHPFEGRIESNIGELNGVFWAVSAGSLLPGFIMLVGSFALSFALVYFGAFKRRRASALS